MKKIASGVAVSILAAAIASQAAATETLVYKKADYSVDLSTVITLYGNTDDGDYNKTGAFTGLDGSASEANIVLMNGPMTAGVEVTVDNNTDATVDLSLVYDDGTLAFGHMGSLLDVSADDTVYYIGGSDSNDGRYLPVDMAIKYTAGSVAVQLEGDDTSAGVGAAYTGAAAGFDVFAGAQVQKDAGASEVTVAALATLSGMAGPASVSAQVGYSDLDADREVAYYVGAELPVGDMITAYGSHDTDETFRAGVKGSVAVISYDAAAYLSSADNSEVDADVEVVADLAPLTLTLDADSLLGSLALEYIATYAVSDALTVTADIDHAVEAGTFDLDLSASYALESGATLGMTASNLILDDTDDNFEAPLNVAVTAAYSF